MRHILSRLLLAGVVVGCSAPAGSPSVAPLPSASPVPSAAPSSDSPSASPGVETPSSPAPEFACAPARTAVPEYQSGADPDWRRLSDPGFAAAVVNDVAAGGPAANGAAFVSVGSARPADEPGSTQWPDAAWWSADGQAWVRASDPPHAGLILRTDDGWLAWGGTEVWRTTDGDRWQRLGSLPLEDDAGTLNQVGFVALGRCLLAAGQAWIGTGADERYELRMWLSLDGRVWVPLAPPTPVGWNDGQISGLASTGDGIIAWGANRAGDVWVPVTLRSIDARTWELGGGGLQVRDYSHDTIVSIAAGPAGLTAVGASLVGEAGEPGRMAAWTSKDGLRWVPAVLDPAPSVEALQHVIWDGDRFVAFGRPGLDEEVWLSADGTRWRRAASVPDVALEGAEDGCTGSAICPRSWVAGAAAGPGAVVAFGGTSLEPLVESGLVWTSPRLLTGP
jgi:hypothetical protein